MRVVWIAAICLLFTAPVFAQTSDADPPSQDDVILFLRTMHSHDMLQKIMEVQAESMRKMLKDLMLKQKGSLPADFDSRLAKSMDEMIKDMPMDQLTQATVPAYQHHFTKGDIAAMNAFYSSPVGQKVLTELPEVMREASQDMMPMLTKYLAEWRERTKDQFEGMGNNSPSSQKSATSPN